MTQPLPLNALEHFSQIQASLLGKDCAFFLDFDGTLSPLVEKPELATISTAMRNCLQTLNQHHFVAIISGRELSNVRQRVGIQQIIYSGNHGLEISGPNINKTHPYITPTYLKQIKRIYHELLNKLHVIQGILIENKRLSLTVHYRLVDSKNIKKIEHAIDNVIAQYPDVTKHLGKKVFEIRPRIAWNKGDTVLNLLEHFNLKNQDIIPICIGDDISDEDTFLAIQTIGISLIVTKTPHQTAAQYFLRNPDEVLCFLDKIKDTK